jgi:hypothetical protein
MRKIRFIPLIIFLLCNQLVFAQSDKTITTNGKDSISKSEKAFDEKVKAVQQENAVIMADGMRSDGKIYVVVGVLVIILIGLFGYLISIDRKISRVEKSIEEQNKK